MYILPDSNATSSFFPTISRPWSILNRVAEHLFISLSIDWSCSVILSKWPVLVKEQWVVQRCFSIRRLLVSVFIFFFRCSSRIVLVRSSHFLLPSITRWVSTTRIALHCIAVAYDSIAARTCAEMSSMSSAFNAGKGRFIPSNSTIGVSTPLTRTTKLPLPGCTSTTKRCDTVHHLQVRRKNVT